MNTIDRIHEAARSATEKSLDRPLFLDADLGLYLLANLDDRKKVYLDVPLASIVALGRKDFWGSGDTWRSATYALVGEGWTDDVIEYFESPTEERFFPAPNSNHQLRLITYGGAVECGNGNHRLVAARAWLTKKYGDYARLKQVHVTACSLNPSFRAFLESAVGSGVGVSIARPSRDPNRSYSWEGGSVELFLKSSESPVATHAYVDGRLVAMNIKSSWIKGWLPRLISPERDRLSWRVIPLDVVQVLLDDSWVESQVSGAKIWGDVGL